MGNKKNSSSTTGLDKMAKSGETGAFFTDGRFYIVSFSSFMSINCFLLS